MPNNTNLPNSTILKSVQKPARYAGGEYGEIINELLGQLVNWSFLRERDLLYFQLGFHYSCLNNETEKPEGYIRLTSQTGHEIKNVILYQILAARLFLTSLTV